MNSSSQFILKAAWKAIKVGWRQAFYTSCLHQFYPSTNKLRYFLSFFFIFRSQFWPALFSSRMCFRPFDAFMKRFFFLFGGKMGKFNWCKASGWWRFGFDSEYLWRLYRDHAWFREWDWIKWLFVDLVTRNREKGEGKRKKTRRKSPELLLWLFGLDYSLLLYLFSLRVSHPIMIILFVFSFACLPIKANCFMFERLKERSTKSC